MSVSPKVMSFIDEVAQNMKQNPTQDSMLADRQATHGDFTDHARIAQGLKAQVHSEDGWRRMRPTQREAVDMILHKIARMVAGNADFADHLLDIEGYAKIARIRIPGPEKAEPGVKIDILNRG